MVMGHDALGSLKLIEMVRVVKDIDLIDHVGEYDVCLVGTNLYVSMSNGFQYQVAKLYPYVFERNLETKYGDIFKMGTIVKCEEEGCPTFCLCFISKGCGFRQDQGKEYISYEALEKCLRLVNIVYKGKRIATTMIGCNKYDGNGSKEKVVEIVERTMKDVDITLYDYEQKNRSGIKPIERRHFTYIRKNKNKQDKDDGNT